MPVSLPLRETASPHDAEGVAAAIRAARQRGEGVYPLGGQTSLDFGLPAKMPGVGLSLAGLNRVVDYAARDMTITVEAGITMEVLAQTLAGEGQRLPIDVPQPTVATLGGVVATNFSGPRRYGCGTIRDYVIGIAAVDGRGTLFHGGGRVVKNVAGYDFCKLLTGSLGTLGVITQMTLKVKPTVERSVFLACDLPDFDLPTFAAAERLLAALVTSQTTPTAIELVAGPAWRGTLPFSADDDPSPNAAMLLVGLEGTALEVDWMIAQLQREWEALEVRRVHVIGDREAPGVWTMLTDFPAVGESPLVLKAQLLPSKLAEFCTLVQSIDPNCSLLAHAGSGVVIVRFADFPPAAVSKALIGRLQPAAANAGGNVVVLRSDASLGELPRQAVWGGRGADVDAMLSVKNQFDPDHLLNPGRFVY